MKIIVTRFLVVCCFLFVALQSMAQIDTAFWFAVPHITHSHAGRPIKLCITTMGDPATVTITQPARNNTQITQFSVPANSSQTYQLVGSSENDLTNFECNQNQTSNFGLYIRSTAKVNAYVFVQNNNSEIYSLKGRNAYGTSFLIPMQAQFPNSNAYADARNSVEIIATQDNTTVTIIPSVALYGGRPANTPFQVTLNRGQVYSFASSSTAAANHLDRTTITSNKPVVVDVTDDSVTPNVSNQDLVADQIVPEELAGQEYIAIPSPAAANNINSGSMGDYVFMYPLENGTDISVYSSTNPAGLPSTETSFSNVNRGEKRSYHFVNNNPVYIYSTKPMYVFQVTGAGNELGGTLLPHIYCTGSTMASYRPEPSVNGSSHTKHIYWILVCKNQFTSGFQINGQSNLLSASDWKVVPEQTSYSYCCKEITSLNTATSVRITNSLGKFHMGVIDYHQPGFGYDDCSIGYFSDYSSASKVSWLTDSMQLNLCEGDTLFLRTETVDADILRVEGPGNCVITEEPFLLSDVQPENTGWFTVVAKDNRNCLVETLTDSIWIDVHPTITQEISDTVCFGAPYQGFGFSFSEDQTLQNGLLKDTIRLQTAEFGCDSVVIMNLEVRDSVRTAFEQRVCDEYVWNGTPYTASGDWHQILTDVHGCDSIVTLHLEVVEGIAQLTQSDDDLCEDGFTVLSVNSNFNNYLWSTGETTETIEVQQAGTYSVTATEGDCEVKGVISVDPCPFNLFLPNAISPNADGLNDYFELTNKNDIKTCFVYIYNRVGGLVFYSEDVNFKWNGEENGAIRHNNMYNYRIEYTNQYGRAIVVKGSILVL